MFKTFRHRLLFWFLVFISFGLMVMLLSFAYLNRRDGILNKIATIEAAHFQLLKSVESQQYFFGYETKSHNYFLEGKSEYLNNYLNHKNATLAHLNKVDFIAQPNIQGKITEVRTQITEIDTLFLFLTQKVKERGFKDYNLEGSMRTHAHWLETIAEIPTAHILTLRRHEKDYIIRNETGYVLKLNTLVDDIQQALNKQSRISPQRKDSIQFHLTRYKDKFNQMVTLDSLIGIKNNTGYKQLLDDKIAKTEGNFNRVLELSNQWKEHEFNRLQLLFSGLGIVVLLLSVFLSALISKKITTPLTDLTRHITRFVESNFTLETEHPVVKTEDEIGSLTRNFSHLKDEVINRLKFFKQKVDERTAELANANKKLLKLSKANSRFVPDEFLDNLGKGGIEEVSLGDHVERNMTVIFTDIRNFTQLSESLTPAENFDFINAYLSGIVPIIEKNGGFIDKFIGDSVMALFPNNPSDAINAAFEFEEFLKQFNQEQQAKGLPSIQMGTGIHTGDLILGTIGHNNRLETTVISDAVNTAARIEGLTKFYDAKVIGTNETLNQLSNKETFEYRFIDKVQVKGKTKVVEVFEFLSPNENEKRLYLDEYEKGVALIREKKIEYAALLFDALANKYPKDKAVQILKERCDNYNANGDDGWSDFTQMITK